jgi:zinc transporter 9
MESDSRGHGASSLNETTDHGHNRSIWDDSSIRAVLVAIAGNGIVTIAKFFGWMISRSPSMLAETIHSLADTANQILLLVGIRHGAGRPTKEFPFGKGRARYIWNLISAVGIFFLGFGFTTWHGIEQLVQARPTDPIYEGPWTTPILLLALAIEGYTLFVALRSVNEARGETGFWEFVRRGDDPTGVAVLLEDSIAVLGVAVAFTGITLSRHLQSPIPDAVASIVIGGLLGVMAVTLALANARILMGASAGQDREQEIREYLEALPAIERVTSLKTAVLAPGNVRLAAEIEFHGSTFIDRHMIERDAERIRDGDDPTPVLFETAERMVRVMGREINRLEAQIRQEFPEITYIDLEVN